MQDGFGAARYLVRNVTVGLLEKGIAPGAVRVPIQRIDHDRQSLITAGWCFDCRSPFCSFRKYSRRCRKDFKAHMSSAFIVASIVTHLPQRDDVVRDAQASEPDLGPERARSNIIGYIFGVTPGLAIWIVFGLTTSYRKIMYEKLVPDRLRGKTSQSLPLPQHFRPESLHNPSASTMPKSKHPKEGIEIELQIPVSERDTQRVGSCSASRDETSRTRTGESSEVTGLPLLEYSPLEQTQPKNDIR
jgi:hypothetical protein